MRRVSYYEHGGPDVLTLEEVDVPVPGPGQVLVRVEAIGTNFVDTKIRRGEGALFRRPLPGRPTGDVVGTVDAVGPDVDPGQIGLRIATLAEDAYADFVLADALWLAPVPEGLDIGSASMLPMGAPVALRTLRTGALAPGETVLIHAAAGGIGHLAVQLAKLHGATVIATVGSAAKADFARECGADFAVDYTDADWADQVRSCAPLGVDVVLDSVGGETLRRSFDVLAPYGRIVVYGAASGDLEDVSVRNLFELKSVAGFSLMAWRTARREQARAEMAEVSEHFTAGRLRTTVHATLPLAEAAEAHRLLENRSTRGRVLLVTS
jgi:NADPH2:quinone reductase